MDDKPVDRAVEAHAQGGQVEVDCPDGSKLTMTPEAALATSENLLVESLRAMGEAVPPAGGKAGTPAP